MSISLGTRRRRASCRSAVEPERECQSVRHAQEADWYPFERRELLRLPSPSMFFLC
jgi:hypothetical protein